MQIKWFEIDFNLVGGVCPAISERENVNQNGLSRSEVRDQMKQHTRQRYSLAKAVSLSVLS